MTVFSGVAASYVIVMSSIVGWAFGTGAAAVIALRGGGGAGGGPPAPSS